MVYLIKFFVLAVGLLHFYFLILEMFFWAKPVGLKIFKQSLEKAKSSELLAKNQGLYNGFLGAGLIWSLLHPNELFAKQIQYYFLSCVILAGIYGAYTVNKRIFYVQAMPAIIALLLIALGFSN